MCTIPENRRHHEQKPNVPKNDSPKSFLPSLAISKTNPPTLLPRIKTKLQVQTKRDPNAPHDPNQPHYTSTWDAMVKITQAEGITGLYAGMTGCLIGVASTNFAY